MIQNYILKLHRIVPDFKCHWNLQKEGKEVNVSREWERLAGGTLGVSVASTHNIPVTPPLPN